MKILYFRKRLRITLTTPLDDLYNDALTKSPDYSALLLWGTSTCCAIEALGKFRSGGIAGNANRFYVFVDTYMDPRYGTDYVGGLLYKEALWKHFRNGLAHGFAICHGGFDGQPNYFDVKNIAGHDALLINPKDFYSDFRSGLAQYLIDLKSGWRAPTQIVTDFETVFDDVYINGN